MSKYYVLGNNPFDNGRVTIVRDIKGAAQYFGSFLDACKSANELSEMKVMDGIRIIKIKT